MKLKKFVVTLLASLTICTTTITIATPPLETEAHSGRTDQYGGHRDTKNKSGLGSYHYHCGGYPAHLHPNGICPYSGSSNVSSSSSSSTKASSTPSLASTTTINPVQNTDDILKVKYKPYTDDYNNKLKNGYFRQDINETTAQFIANPENTTYINSLLTSDETTDLLTGSSSTVKYDILSKILYLRVYDVVLQQTEAQTQVVQQDNTSSDTESNNMNQDDFLYNLVFQTQTQLMVLNFYTGDIDGIFDTETQQALINFQNAFGLIPDGTINQQVVEALSIQL